MDALITVLGMALVVFIILPLAILAVPLIAAVVLFGLWATK